MKQILFSLISIFLGITNSVNAQDIKNFIEQAKQEQHYQEITLQNMTDLDLNNKAISLEFIKNNGDKETLLKNIKICYVKNCSKKFQHKIKQILKKEQFNNCMKVLTACNNPKANSRIWAKVKEEKINSLFLVSYTKKKKDCVFFYLKENIDNLNLKIGRK